VAVKATTVVTLAQAREWCLQDASDDTRDAILSLCADAASERLERETGRVFKRRTLTETVSADGVGRVLYLRRFPVVSVASVTIDGQLAAASSYAVDADAGRIFTADGAAFPGGVQNVVIVYDAGYDAASLPSDVVELALQLTARLFKMRSRGGSSFEQVSVGGNSFAVRDNLPTDMTRAIERLRDKRFG